jgi:BCCT family betaine/carnitine transporter
VFRHVFEGLVAATLLIVGGSQALTALEAMAVSTDFPFTIVLLAAYTYFAACIQDPPAT